MDIFLHTIALEPARWTPARVSRSLVDLVPVIAAAGFSQIEVYEPHLRDRSEWEAIRESLQRHAVQPVILSSYVRLGAEDAEAGLEGIRTAAEFFGFRKVRLFPGSGVSPDDRPAVDRFTRNLAAAVETLDGLEILLETHDGSIADAPARVVEVVQAVGSPRVGLLFQPTVFDGSSELAQFAVQKPFLRHVHLQNRASSGGFATLADGVTPWRTILTDLPGGTAASLEFVPRGIRPVAEFSLEEVIREAVEEKASALRLASA